MEVKALLVGQSAEPVLQEEIRRFLMAREEIADVLNLITLQNGADSGGRMRGPIGSALCRLEQRDMPSPYRFDEQHRLRVVAVSILFPGTVDTAFNQIRRYARSSAAVTIRLLETIAVIAGVLHRPGDRTALRRHAEMIIRGAREGLPEDGDRRAAEEGYQTASRALCEPDVRAHAGLEAPGAT